MDLPHGWPQCNRAFRLSEFVLSNVTTVVFYGDSLTFQVSRWFKCELWAAGYVVDWRNLGLPKGGWGEVVDMTIRRSHSDNFRRKIVLVSSRTVSQLFYQTYVRNASIVVVGAQLPTVRHRLQNFTEEVTGEIMNIRPGQPTILTEAWPTHWQNRSYINSVGRNSSFCAKTSSYDGLDSIQGQPLQQWLRQLAKRRNMTFMGGASEILNSHGHWHAGYFGARDCLHWCDYPVITHLVTTGLLDAMFRSGALTTGTST